jgi:hypothetical protein
VHNTTEGLAIVAPLVGHRASLCRLGGHGLIAGAPAIVGALVGASVDNAALAALLFGVGVGAVAQVLVQILPSLRDPTTGENLQADQMVSVAGRRSDPTVRLQAPYRRRRLRRTSHGSGASAPPTVMTMTSQT